MPLSLAKIVKGVTLLGKDTWQPEDILLTTL